MTAVADLRALIASRHSLIVAVTRDETSLRHTVQEAAAQLSLPCWEWSAAAGLALAGGSGQVNTKDPAGALAFLREMRRPVVALLLDAEAILDSPVALRLAKDIATNGGTTLMLTGLPGGIPPALDGLAITWAMPPPDREQMRSIVERVLGTLPQMGLRVETRDVNRLVEAVMGLTPREAEQVLLREAVVDGRLDDSDAAAAHRARAELLSDGPLDLIDPEVTLADVGGLATLKEWLTQRALGFQPRAREFGLDAPRGVLLAGVPGCGKSMVARAVAGSWHVALAALDVGRLHGSLVGESESRLREALAASVAMAPVVLWIDEVEKAFAESGESDGGVSQRVLGVLLRWLQDRPDGVFLVATCNDVTKLPPEVTRRGRFDELFFVDLPDLLERRTILAHHLRTRRRDPAAFDLDALAVTSGGFSGAELESAVTAALYTAYSRGCDIDTAALLAELRRTVPLSVTRAEDVAALRLWAKGRARPAGGSPPPRVPV